MSEDAAAIEELIHRHVAAIRAKDIDAVMSSFAPEVVSFDLGPPLQHGGGEPFVRHWQELFHAYQGAIDYDISDLSITVGEEVAFSRSLNRTSGTIGNGKRSERWLRWTACYRKIGGRWLIVHEHVSVPVDSRSGKACLDLTPEAR